MFAAHAECDPDTVVTSSVQEFNFMNVVDTTFAPPGIPPPRYLCTQEMKRRRFHHP